MLTLFRRNRGGSDPRERRPSARTPRRLTLESLEGRALLSAGPTTAQVAPQAATTFTVSQSLPIPPGTKVSVPGANGAPGEVVDLSGNVHALFHITYDGYGGVHVKFQTNYQGVSGVGETTGDQYQGNGVSEEEKNVQAEEDVYTAVGEELTEVLHFQMIDQVTRTNFLVREDFHFTINYNGTVTAFVDNLSVQS